MGYVTSLFIVKYNLAAAFRIQKLNCNPSEILNKYNDSEIKYIILKQYMGRSYITTKPGIHESLGLQMYVQCTSPLRRYLDLIIQRQVYNKINNYEILSKDSVSMIIDYSKNRQSENNNIFKNDKLKYLRLFFKNEKKACYKIIFVKWINHKRNIALVYFPDYSLEILITLFVSIEVFSNKIYKVKFINNDNNNLDFIY
jgi:exoribonuclease-2